MHEEDFLLEGDKMRKGPAEWADLYKLGCKDMNDEERDLRISDGKRW